jgi:hypothetical protein
MMPPSGSSGSVSLMRVLIFSIAAAMLPFSGSISVTLMTDSTTW